MKRIKRNELPLELNAETIEILVKMALESPKATFDWSEVSDLLEERNQLAFILNKVEERKKITEQIKENAKSEEQKQTEKEDGPRFLDKANPNSFYGNMGEPMTLEDYKLRYGRYPAGYDEKGNTINK
jgi:hypothetical protein